MTVNSLAPFNPTGDGAITSALDMLQPTEKDILYDIGCGDGRVLLQAALRVDHLRCVGIETDARLADRALDEIKAQNLSDRITIHQKNALEMDYSAATLVFIYLVPKGILLLQHELEQMKARGVRIVAYLFSIPHWIPKEIRTYKNTKVYLYHN